MGVGFMLEGKDAAASQSFAKAIELGSSNATAYLGWGIALLREELRVARGAVSKRAADALRRAAALDPDLFVEAKALRDLLH